LTVASPDGPAPTTATRLDADIAGTLARVAAKGMPSPPLAGRARESLRLRPRMRARD